MRNIVFGLILIMLSTSGLALVVWRFALLQRYVPFLLRWGGRGSHWLPGFPATKIGVGAGCIVGISMGFGCLDSEFKFLPSAVWAGIMGIVFVLVIAAAIHDYLLHRKRKAYQEAAANRRPAGELHGRAR